MGSIQVIAVLMEFESSKHILDAQHAQLCNKEANGGVQ